MNEKLESVRTHFIENKKLYIGLGIGAAVGVVGMALVVRTNLQIVDALKVQINSPTTNNVVQVNMVRPGPKAFVVQCLESQKTWPSIRAAAEDLGVNASDISRHLKGRIPEVKGSTFSKIAEI